MKRDMDLIRALLLKVEGEEPQDLSSGGWGRVSRIANWVRGEWEPWGGGSPILHLHGAAACG